MRPIEATVVLVTGATDGLGRAVATDLAARGATVHLHGRDQGRLDAVVGAISDATPGARLHTHLADLASLEEVRALAADVTAGTDHLHVLVNNAGIGFGEPDGTERRTSRDGLELRFAVNHLAGLVLTLRLLPLLEASAPARIVHVASIAQRATDFDDPQMERGYDGARAYGQSKLAQIACGLELAGRLDGTGVTVTSLHPATFMPTKMVLRSGRSAIETLEAGTAATVRLAVDAELEGVSGTFFDREREADPDAWALDPDNRRRLWELSLELTGEPDPTR